MMRKVRSALEGTVLVELIGAALLYVGTVLALTYPVFRAISF